MAIAIVSQNFNALSSESAFTADSIASGGELTNGGSRSLGGVGLDFRTFWFDVRGVTNGPVTASNDSNDFIGVNAFTGSGAPDVAADGTPVAAGSEHNFQFNDGDGRLDLVFDAVDMTGHSGRRLVLDYWINDTGYEGEDLFEVTLSDGITSATLLSFGETGLEANASADDGTANWGTLSADLEALFTSAALDPSALALTVSVDTNAGAENVFIDNVLFAAGASGPAAPDARINELRISSPGSTDDTSNFVEILADPGTVLDGLTLVVLSSEFAPGQIDFAVDLAGAATDADGFALLAPVGTDAATDAGDRLLDGLDFFGSPSTFLLVEGFTGAVGDDLDLDDDGTLETVPWAAVKDAVALVEADGTPDRPYADTVVNPGGDFPAAGLARRPDGTGAFEELAFDDRSADTPGATNAPPPPPAPFASIMEIQGAGHVSPFVLGGETVADFLRTLPPGFSVAGEAVTTAGIVTATESNGFYLQDPLGDGDVATADALFVFTAGPPSVAVGDAVDVAGTVSEFFPGGTSTRNLPTTQISNPTVTVASVGNPLPAATVIGMDGRLPPTETIDDDAFASFDPDTDGLDFFEALEGMRVTAQDAVAVAGTNRFGEIFAVVDQGANATGLSRRGTLNISEDDFNPEKIQIDADSDILPTFDFPEVDVGAILGDVTGVVSYDFGYFQINPTEPFTPTAPVAPIVPETTDVAGDGTTLTVATYNVLNLDPNDGDGDEDVANGRFGLIAEQIVANLAAPDVIALQEVQDDDGAIVSTETGADMTLGMLVEAIADAGGPEYAFIDTPGIPEFTGGDSPVGGQPGGNIRNAFLYRTDRVDLVEGSVRTILDGDDDGFPFFEGRIPLEATFAFNGEEVTLLNNHLSSKGGSAPILGIEQPFDERQEDPTVNGSLDQRQDQAQAVAERVSAITAADPDANVIVLGDLNEFEFVSPVEDILGGELVDLGALLPDDERYSFVFQGNSQQLDHVLASEGLAEGARYDIVHVNTEFAQTPSRASDHDPIVAGFSIAPASPVEVEVARVFSVFRVSFITLEVTNVSEARIRDFKLAVDSDDDAVDFLAGFGRDGFRPILFDRREDTFEPRRTVGFDPDETLELTLLARNFDEDEDALTFDFEVEDGPVRSPFESLFGFADDLFA